MTILIIYDVDDENVHLDSPSILIDHRRRGLSLIAWHFKSVEEKRWEYLIDPGVHNDHDSIDEKIWLTECQYWCYPGSRCSSVSGRGAKVLRSHENPRRRYRTHGAMSLHIHIYRTSNLVYFQLKHDIAFGYFTVFCAFNLCSKSLSLGLKSSQRCECTVGVAGVPDNSQSSVKFPPIFLTNHNFFDSNHNFFDGNQFAVQLWWNIASSRSLLQVSWIDRLEMEMHIRCNYDIFSIRAISKEGIQS